MDVCVFFYLAAHRYGGGLSLPLWAVEGRVCDRNLNTWFTEIWFSFWLPCCTLTFLIKQGLVPCIQVERANPSFFLMSGGSWRRGGGTIYAAFILPPEYAGFEGCTAWVGILRFAPRCAAFAVFGGLLRGKYLTTYLFYPFGQSLNCWRRSFRDIFHSLCDIYIENAKNGL